MTIELIDKFVFQLQKKVIGEPNWVEGKQVFEYKDSSIEVVIILKLMRLVQGIRASQVLCENGLFFELGSTQRNVYESIFEIYFLLDGMDNPSSNINKFKDEFFSRTINEHLSSKHNTVETKKILSGASRYMVDKMNQPRARDMHKKIYDTLSGYTHGSYCHIMGMYGSESSFNCLGVKSAIQIENWHKFVDESIQSCLLVVSFVAKEFGEESIYLEASSLLI